MLTKKRVLDDCATKLEIMSDKPGKNHGKLGVSPLQLDVEVVEILESDEEKDFVDVGEATSLPPPHSVGQMNVHAYLKERLEKLCNVLKLKDDVVHLVRILLKDLVENHDVSKGDINHLQAIQMSLCWIATDILGRNPEASLIEAKKKLNFKCDENLANSVYEQLTPLKETFQKLHGKTSDPISLGNVVSPLADTAVHSTHLQKQCVKAEVIEISDHEENKESKDKIGVDKNQERLLHVRKCLKKRKKKLGKKHRDEFQEFNKLWKEKRYKLEEEHKAKLAVFSAIHCPSGTKLENFIEENNKFCQALQDLMLERSALDKKHAEEMEEENRKCEGWLAEAEEEAKYGRGGSTKIDDAYPHELESGNNDQLSKNSGSTSCAPPSIITADALVLDISGDWEIEVVDNEPVHMQVAIPRSDEPATTNVSLQNSNDLAAAKVDYNVPIVTEIPSSNNDTETDSAILGSHVDPLPENEIVDEFMSTNGDPKGDSLCCSDSVPVDTVNHSQNEQYDCSMQSSTVGKDLADCLKPVDPQTVIATDNGNTMVSPLEQGDSAGFLNQPVALNEGHTMLHHSDDSSIQPSSVGKDLADDYLKPVDQQTASTTDHGTSGEQSVVPCSGKDMADDYPTPANQQMSSKTDNGISEEQSIVPCSDVVSSHEQFDTRMSIVDSADCNSLPDSQTAEEPDNICDGAQVDRELSDTHVNIADFADCDSRPDLQTAEEETVEICVGEQSGGAQAHNIASQTQVIDNAGELNKQPALENGEDSLIMSLNNTSDTVESDDHPNLPIVCGTGVEANEPQHSSQDHTLSDVAENTAELQTGAVLQNTSNTVSVDFAASAPHPHFALPSNQWFADPLDREFIKIYNEKEQFDKLHEYNISQLNATCEKEINESSANVRSNYNKKLEDMEASFSKKMTEMEANHKKLIMNKFLASAFYSISLGSSGVVQPGAPSPVASSSSPSPVCPVQRYPVASLSSPQTNTPSAQFTPRPTNQSPTHPPPLQIPTVSPNIGTNHIGGSFVRARAPHLQPFRPPPSPGHPTTGTTAFQQVRLGTNQNALSGCRTSEGQNNRQSEPPRNNYPFSAVELSVTNRTGSVSNEQTLSSLDVPQRHL